MSSPRTAHRWWARRGHADGVVHFATPDAAVAYPAALVASASAPFIGPLGFGVGVGIAGASATRHPSGSIVERAEAELGLSVADQAAIDWGPAGGAPELQLYRAGMWSATAYGAGLAYLDRYYTANVARGMSPNGASLDGRPIVIGVFEVRAFPDEQTGRIAEIYIPSMRPASPLESRSARSSRSPPMAASHRSTSEAKPSSSSRDPALRTPRSRRRIPMPRTACRWR